jgi:hypothetical protein
MTDKLYTYVGNYKEYSDDILSEYSLPNNKTTYEWEKIRYLDLPTLMMKICTDSCVKSGEEELLNSNPFVIVERHHNILCKDGKVKNHFASHTDNEGPAGGPCNSILYYYQIDGDIDDVGLHFYKWIDEDKIIITQDAPVATFIPVTGDIVTFGDNIPHCPGEFKTESDTPKVRGVFAIFIIHPVSNKSVIHPVSNPKKCCIVM